MIEGSDKNPTEELKSTLNGNNSTEQQQKLKHEDNQLVGNEDDGDDLKNSPKWVKFDSRPDVKTNDATLVTDNLEEIKLDNSLDKENNKILHNGAQSELKNEPAVLDTEIIHVTIEQPLSPANKKAIPVDVVDNIQPSRPPRSTVAVQSKTSGPAVIDVPTPQLGMNGYNEINSHEMRTIDLSNAKFRGERYSNGDKIVSLPPASSGFSWIKTVRFKPELVPEELMAQGLTLTVEDYVSSLETLVNDYRFSLYNFCYKRILLIWVVFSFLVLIGILFSGLVGIELFTCGVVWLFLNAGAIFLCMFIKVNLARDLERCIGRVNKQLLRHRVLLILEDRGNFSCQNVNLCFIYFDAVQCIDCLNEFIEKSESNKGETNQNGGWKKLDVPTDDIIIQGSNTTRVSRRQTRAEEAFLRYIQRWGKDFLRRRLDWTVDDEGVNISPRHLSTAYCPCQYIEEIIIQKSRKLSSSRSIFARVNNWCAGYGFQLY